MTGVVVTGMGVLSPYGLGSEALWQGVSSQSSGLGPLPDPYSAISPGFGGVVNTPWKDLRALPGMRSLRPSTMTRYTFLACGALGDALVDSGLDLAHDPRRRGLYLGSSCNTDRMAKYVQFDTLVANEEARSQGRYVIDDSLLPQGMRLFTGFEILKLMNNMPAAHAGIAAACQGPINTFLGTTNAGLQAIERAARDIRSGEVDVMLAGGVGASCHELLMLFKGHRGELVPQGDDPKTAGRPFDAGAQGEVPGEAAVFLVLESEDHARERGARVRAQVLAQASGFDPQDPADAAVETAELALAQAGRQASEIDLVLPTGSSRPEVDAWEAQAIGTVLGDHRPAWFCASPLVGLPESAAGVLAAALGILAMEKGEIPANPNTPNPIANWPLGSGAERTNGTSTLTWVHGASPDGVQASLFLGK